MWKNVFCAALVAMAAGAAGAHGPVATGFSGGGGGSACRTSACAQVTDSNADGDIAPEFQSAINSVLWPDVTLDGVTIGRQGQQYQTATWIYWAPTANAGSKQCRLMIACH